MLRKFRQDSDAWLVYAEFLFSHPQLKPGGRENQQSSTLTADFWTKKKTAEKVVDVHAGLERARALLPRALQSLEKRTHIPVISRFAQVRPDWRNALFDFFTLVLVYHSVCWFTILCVCLLF